MTFFSFLATSNKYYDSLTIGFELDSMQTKEVNNFKTLNTIRAGILGENRTFKALTTTELNTITTIATSSYLASGAMAKVMLRQVDGYYLPTVTLPNPLFTKRLRVKVPWPNGEPQNENIENFKPIFYPNPANGVLNLLTNLDASAVLKVVDVNGRLIHYQVLKVGYQNLAINTNSWSPGIYVGKIIQDEEIIYQEKLTLN
jgi:hypothetical protein